MSYMAVSSLKTMLRERHARSFGNDTITDWRPYWKTVFSFRWPRLRRLVSLYLSLDVGSCQLERDLGQLAHLTRIKCCAAQTDCADLERCLEIMARKRRVTCVTGEFQRRQHCNCRVTFACR